MNGDLVTAGRRRRACSTSTTRGRSPATIGVRRYVAHRARSAASSRDGDRVTALEEKPTIAREVNAGIYALDPARRRPRGAGRRADRCPTSSASAIDRGEPVGAFEIEDDWIDVGQREQLAARTGGTADERCARSGSSSPAPTASSAATSSSASSREGARVRAFCLYNSRGSLRAGSTRPTADVRARDRRPARRHPRRARSSRRRCDGRRGRLPSRGADRHPVLVHRPPESFVDTNVSGTLNVLEAARRAGVRRVVQTSTSEVYGTPETLPIRETHPLQAQSPYAATKVAADQLALAYHRSFGLPVVVLRPFNTYGPRQSAARGAADDPPPAARRARREIQLGRLDPRRDLTYRRRHGRRVRPGRRPRRDRRADDPARHRPRGLDRRAVRPRLPAHRQRGDVVEDPPRLRPDASEVLVLQSDPALARELLGWRAATSPRGRHRAQRSTGCAASRRRGPTGVQL